GDGEAGHALSRHRAAGEGHVWDANLRLPGVRRIRDDRGRRQQRLDRWRARDDGKPARLQARRRRWHLDVLRAAGGGETEGGLGGEQGVPNGKYHSPFAFYPAPESPEYFGLLIVAGPWHAESRFPCAARDIVIGEENHVLQRFG